MEVELDVFSGQPNPRWPLGPADAEQLAVLVGGLPPSSEEAEPPGLGYRGFTFSLEDSGWRAWRGVVWSDSARLADPDRSVERFLLGCLPEEHNALTTRLETELGL